MKETSNINEIVELINGGTYQLICIDGVDGAGKSTLAKNLSESLGVNCITLDDYVENEKGSYVEFLDLDRLNEALSYPLKPIIIDGICLLDVLSRIGISPDLLVYVKRMSSYGSWRDEDVCEITEDIEEFIRKEEQDLKDFCVVEAEIENSEFNEKEFSFSKLRKEIFRYHYNYSPHKKADVIFARKDC